MREAPILECEVELGNTSSETPLVKTRGDKLTVQVVCRERDDGTQDCAAHLASNNACVQRVDEITNCSTGPHGEHVQAEISEAVLDAEGINIGQDSLLADQRRAFDIINWHLKETLAHRDPPQLLMQIHGEGGTGKSMVIRAVTKFFEAERVGGMLSRSAYTGIAASIIDGKTLHTIAGLPLKGRLPSDATVRRVAALAILRHYLILDEVSMISKPFFARLSAVFDMIADALGVNSKGRPFGGLNVVIVGDFHQFPPVASKTNGSLYWPIDLSSNTADDILGCQLFEKSERMVILREQVWVVDAVWLDFLRHARRGECQPSHIRMLRQLVLTNRDCPLADSQSCRGIKRSLLLHVMGYGCFGMTKRYGNTVVRQGIHCFVAERRIEYHGENYLWRRGLQWRVKGRRIGRDGKSDRDYLRWSSLQRAWKSW